MDLKLRYVLEPSTKVDIQSSTPRAQVTTLIRQLLVALPDDPNRTALLRHHCPFILRGAYPPVSLDYQPQFSASIILLGSLPFSANSDKRYT